MRATNRLSTRTDTSDASYARTPSGVRARVLEAIRERPRSCDELMVDLGLQHSTCSAAINALMRQRLVADLGVRTITRAGRTAIVWEVPPFIPPVAPAGPTRRELANRVELAVTMLRGRCCDDVIDVLRGIYGS